MRARSRGGARCGPAAELSPVGDDEDRRRRNRAVGGALPAGELRRERDRVAERGALGRMQRAQRGNGELTIVGRRQRDVRATCKPDDGDAVLLGQAIEQRARRAPCGLEP